MVFFPSYRSRKDNIHKVNIICNQTDNIMFAETNVHILKLNSQIMEIWYYNREVQPYLSFCQLILGREERREQTRADCEKNHKIRYPLHINN